MTHLNISRIFILLIAGFVLNGCTNSTTIKSTRHVPLQQQTTTIPENQLLDVGVVTFDPGLDESDDDDAVLPEVRNAESYYLANQLRSAIQDSAAWGAVRVLPSTKPVTDVYVQGTILESTGESLKLAIAVSDTSRQSWYKKTYAVKASEYAYQRRKTLQRDPFSGLFNQIANDLLSYREKLDSNTAVKLRTISELRFARDFSPESFDQHIVENRKGLLEISRLPARNDPILARIQKIQMRDDLYVDTMQEYYDNFSLRMEEPYQVWRAESYNEVIAARELKRQGTGRILGGIAAVVVGIVAAGSSDGSARAAGAVAIGSGGLLVQSGIGKRAEAQMHVEALAELGQSLEAELEPQVIDLEDRTITLTGNVESQYQQWRDVLQQIYRAESGG
ncbi:MAG: hypothetical protein V7717_06660 [Porticoccaceae bacterium]